MKYKKNEMQTKKMTSHEVRKSFVSYFSKNDHKHLKSSSLVPDGGDLLFTNSGMNQFKNVFLGLEKLKEDKVVTYQKCLRAGGKHNDLENVGHTARHHTFFEMLGNFSFGNYFKKEAICYAWDYLTKTLGLEKDRLYISVFKDDQESFDIWHSQEKVPKDRIFKFGEKDNFWRMGSTGPCGPCSEIYYDHYPEKGEAKNINDDDTDRFVEIWNLVFMQFYESEKSRTKIPKPCVDTGAGLERLTAVMQNTNVNFETDLFLYLIDKLSNITNVSYQKDTETIIAMRVLADHARASTFLIADGVMPSNDGRGYVLRRIIRRAIRYSRKLSDHTNLLSSLSHEVISNMADVYPELDEHRELILRATKNEEEKFIQTLEQGEELLNKALEKASNKTLDGKIAFKLYDTYGFPVDLTKIIANEKGFTVDEKSFLKHMSKAKEISKTTWSGQHIDKDETHVMEFIGTHKETDFVGYEQLKCKGKVLAISDTKKITTTLDSNQVGFLILDKTPFYAESGGQIGDRGAILNLAQMQNCVKRNGVFVHVVKVNKGKQIAVGDTVDLAVDEYTRQQTANNHSAAHLLNSALKNVLGDHIKQAGSQVTNEKFRFDFTHDKQVTPDEILLMENEINQIISKGIDVIHESMEYDTAMKKGALGMFGEKYGNIVRTIKMGDVSFELCGGTHVKNTSSIQVFKIVSEGSIKSGVRRIEAVAGAEGTKFLLKNTRENILSKKTAQVQYSWHDYKNDHFVLPKWIEQQKTLEKDLKKQVKLAKRPTVKIDQYIKGIQEIKDHKFLLVHIETDDRKYLMLTLEKLKAKIISGIIIVVGKDKKSPLIVSVSEDIQLKAGDILNTVTKIAGGEGGGKPNLAQGFILDTSKLDKCKEFVGKYIEDNI